MRKPHGSTRTTREMRAEIQESEETNTALAQRFGVSRTTIDKWRARKFVGNAPMGPRMPRSTVLSLTEEAVAVQIRRISLLPLDDVLASLKAAFPHLARSSLHRCLKRHCISRLPRNLNELGLKDRTETDVIRVHHTELRIGKIRIHIIAAIHLPSTFCVFKVQDRDCIEDREKLLADIVSGFPQRVNTIVCSNEFVRSYYSKWTISNYSASGKIEGFVESCKSLNVAAKLIRDIYPWDSLQENRMWRISESSVKEYVSWLTVDFLRSKLLDFAWRHNRENYLRSLDGMTPIQFLTQSWIRDPEAFHMDPREL